VGRSVPTFREELENILHRWEIFGSALRKEERSYLDSVIARARHLSYASAYAIFQNPVESALLSVLVEQEKEIERIKAILSEK